MSMTRVVDPVVEPVTLTEAKNHLKVDDEGSPAHPDDDLIENLITASREWCEAYTGRSFIEQTWRVTLDEFPKEIVLPRPPLMDVESIQYIDLSGNTQTVSTSVYRVDLDGSRITLEDTQSWPDTLNVSNAVTIRFRSGYDSGSSPQDASKVPSSIKAAILLMLGSLYEHRQEVLTGLNVSQITGNMSVRSLLSPHMVDKYRATV